MPVPATPDQRLRPLQKTLIGLFVAFLAATIAVGIFADRLFAPTPLAHKPVQGDFRLKTTAGAEFSPASLQGAGPTLVFFGYTHCPDVCPTTLGDIAEWQQALGERAKGLRVFLITVDPERDDIAQLRDYLSWTDGVIGVTGARIDIDKAAKAFGIYSSAPPAHSNAAHNMTYTVDHSTPVLLLNNDGAMVDQIPYQTPVAQAVAKLMALLTANPTL